MKNVGLLPSGEVDGEKNEIIVYQPEGGEFHIEVRVDQDTVWLTQAQMAELFNSTRNNVTLHIKNIFQERELDANSVCKESLLTANDGKKYKTKIYNLDVIISVGYRVKSIQGTRFRQWALRVLKEHMLKGFSVNQRLVSHENKLENHDSRIIGLESAIKMVFPGQALLFNNFQCVINNVAQRLFDEAVIINSINKIYHFSTLNTNKRAVLLLGGSSPTLY